MMKLMLFQQLGLAFLLLAGLIGCDAAAPEGSPEVIDPVFVSPPGDSPAAVAVNPHSDYV